VNETEFNKQVANAYEHLYDFVYLRTHPLADILVSDPFSRRREKAWQLHHLLLDVIEEINPGPHAPPFSREWRRHRLLVLHYVDGLDPQAVATELGISRRHYYREHEAAVEAVASILWQRYVIHPAQAQSTSPASDEPVSIGRLELLRLEAARTAQVNRCTQVGEVIRGVHVLLQETLDQRQLRLHLALPDLLPAPLIDQGLLRQVLLGLLGYLIERASQAVIQLRARQLKSKLYLTLVIEPPAAIHSPLKAEVQERLAAFREMVALSNSSIEPIYTGDVVAGFSLQLPTGPQRTVLVVDDNEDVLELFHRYLSCHNYYVFTAQNAPEALQLARRLHPYAITLDLMMPDQDGWDLLQTLLNQPETSQIPVIVCSVLPQKELALLLGAARFLQKPVSDQELVEALEALAEP
jgi:CheY-like chemotaxis protein